MKVISNELLIRKAVPSDATFLCNCWNNGDVMKHVGFPDGLHKTVDVVEKHILSNEHCLVLVLDGQLIGEAHYKEVDSNTCDIGIKICVTSCQNKGYGRKFLSMMIEHLFCELHYEKIVLDTDLENLRAQHVYESLGFEKIKVRYDSWKDLEGNSRSAIDYELTPNKFISY